MSPSRMLLLALPIAACTTPEEIRVRDRDGLLYVGRARLQQTIASNQKLAVAIGAELGGYATSGDYTSPTGVKDYSIAVGYAAGTIETSVRDFRILTRLGLAIGDFEVEGQNRPLRENGLGGVVGAEGRYAATDSLDFVVRGTLFTRSSLDNTLLEFGLEWQPVEHIGIEIAYGIAKNVIEETLPLVAPQDEADVETQGLLIGMTLIF